MNILKMIYNEIEQEIEDSGICVDYESNEEIIARLIERIAHKHIPSPSPGRLDVPENLTVIVVTETVNKGKMNYGIFNGYNVSCSY